MLQRSPIQFNLAQVSSPKLHKCQVEYHFNCSSGSIPSHSATEICRGLIFYLRFILQCIVRLTFLILTSLWPFYLKWGSMKIPGFFQVNCWKHPGNEYRDVSVKRQLFFPRYPRIHPLVPYCACALRRCNNPDGDTRGIFCMILCIIIISFLQKSKISKYAKYTWFLCAWLQAGALIVFIDHTVMQSTFLLGFLEGNSR